ncbi:MAG: SulP family inorganic anion transporter, partial [Bacteroidia bacterium]
AYNMSEWRSFIAVLRTSKSDAAVLLATFLLTVFVDLTVAIEIGMVLAVFLFMRRMTQISHVDIITKEISEADDDKAISRYKVPEGVEVFEVTGPMFFGAAYKFKESLKLMAKSPKILIIRMRFVPVIDATGLHTLEEVFKQSKNKEIKFILSGVQKGVYHELEKSHLLELIGKENVCVDIDAALAHARQILNQDV